MHDDHVRGSDRREFLTRAGMAGLGATAVGGLVAERALGQGKAKGNGRGRPAYDLPGEAGLGGNISTSVWYCFFLVFLTRIVN